MSAGTDEHEAASPAEELHKVRIARATFEYAPVVDLPAWWTPGDRRTARLGETITVDASDFERGRRFCAFAGVPPLPTHTVTIRHAAFAHTPVPYPSTRLEGHEVLALCGETIQVLEDDFQRGLAHGAFTENHTPSRFGRAGDPPLDGSRLDFVNWARTAGPVALELLCDDVEQLVAEVAADRGPGPDDDSADEVRRLLVLQPRDVLVDFTRLDLEGDEAPDAKHRFVDRVERRQPVPLTMNIERAFDLIQPLRRQQLGTPPELTQDEQRLLEQVAKGLVTNPEVLQLVLKAGVG
jgi:hypothetical protein